MAQSSPSHFGFGDRYNALAIKAFSNKSAVKQTAKIVIVGFRMQIEVSSVQPRSFDRRADNIGHEFRQALALLARQLEAELAAPPENVVRGLRPLMRHQVAHFRASE